MGLAVCAAACAPGGSDSAKEVPGIVWGKSYSLALDQAKREQKPVMLTFYSDTCGWCRRLESETFVDRDVIQTANSFVRVRVNAAEETDLAAQFGAEALPFTVFLNPGGKAYAALSGYLEPKEFQQAMTEALVNPRSHAMK